MKIAFVSNMYPSKKFPVFGVFVKNTEVLLSENKIETITKAVIRGRQKSFFKIIAYALLYVDILKVYCNKKVDLVYVHFPLQTSPILLLCNKFSSKKLVLNIHGSELNNRSFFYNFFINLLKKSDLVVVPSNSFKIKLNKLSNLDLESIFVYPSGGVDPSVFYNTDKSEIRKDLALKNDDFICSYISSLIEDKGWNTFVEAANLLKHLNLKFMIVGNGSDEMKLHKKLKELNLNSSFILFDRKKQLELVKYFNASDVFIFPTQKESLGLVGLEALSCGVPIIASNIDATLEYVKDGVNGFLFEKNSSKSLAEKIEKFYYSTIKDKFKNEALKTSLKYNSKNCSFALAEKLKQL